ncbi:MAG: type VI secretion system baseplate subunit TssE [Deferribacteres bacterium]|nr:type VI secretion system baseplate subunit TssE [Deferribacteres bacterium]
MNPDQQGIQASVLDRLIDNEPGVSHEPVRQRSYTIGQIKAAVVRDLENLLNTRRSILPVPPEYREVGNSLFVYGLRDFTAKNPRNPSVKQQLRGDIEKTISRFERRLKNVTVRIEAEDKNERNIRFRISGMLVADPVTEPVTFDTYFDINRGQYFISK